MIPAIEAYRALIAFNTAINKMTSDEVFKQIAQGWPILNDFRPIGYNNTKHTVDTPT